MGKTKLYTAIARSVEAACKCEARGLNQWEHRHWERAENLTADHCPSGSGWDCGTKLDRESKPERLVFTGSWHHMDEHGMYSGWTDHSIVVTPSLAFGFTLRVTGRDRNDIKAYLGELFADSLESEVEEFEVVD